MWCQIYDKNDNPLVIKGFINKKFTWKLVTTLKNKKVRLVVSNFAIELEENISPVAIPTVFYMLAISIYRRDRFIRSRYFDINLNMLNEKCLAYKTSDILLIDSTMKSLEFDCTIIKLAIKELYNANIPYLPIMSYKLLLGDVLFETLDDLRIHKVLWKIIHLYVITDT